MLAQQKTTINHVMISTPFHLAKQGIQVNRAASQAKWTFDMKSIHKAHSLYFQQLPRFAILTLSQSWDFVARLRPLKNLTPIRTSLTSTSLPYRKPWHCKTRAGENPRSKTILSTMQSRSVDRKEKRWNTVNYRTQDNWEFWQRDFYCLDCS